MKEKVYLAVDLGAGSGRVLAARTDLRTLELEDIHRFDNPGTNLPGGLVWNILSLYREILHGLSLAVERYGEDITALGIDTWGVDFALLDAQGRLLGLPHQYRDSRTDGMEEECERRYGNAKMYRETGIMPFFLNSSHQLLGEAVRDGVALLNASHFLMIPDLLAFWLTGRIAVERTNASTTQLFSPLTKDWAWDVIEGLGLPRHIFGEVVEPGTILGNLREVVAEEIGGDFPVIATTTHDTGAAVTGIPGEGDYAFEFRAFDGIDYSPIVYKTFKLNTQPPTIFITSPSSFSSHDGGYVNFVGTAQDPYGCPSECNKDIGLIYLQIE